MVAGFTSDVKVSLDSPDLLWAQPPFVLEVFWLDPLHFPGQHTLLAVKPTDAGGGGGSSFACL